MGDQQSSMDAHPIYQVSQSVLRTISSKDDIMSTFSENRVYAQTWILSRNSQDGFGPEFLVRDQNRVWINDEKTHSNLDTPIECLLFSN